MWWSRQAGRLEHAERLDGAVDKVTAAVDKVLPAGPVRDVLHGRWLGHQLHPLLVVFPIGMYGSVSVLDYTGDQAARSAAQRLVGAAVLMTAPTAAAGLADWAALGEFRRPRRVGLVHAAANAVTLGIYGASWLARRRGKHGHGRRLALAGLLGLSVSGYLGGHLSYAQGVGVNRNADKDKLPRDWTDAAASADVGAGQLYRVDVGGYPVVLTRHEGQVYALGGTCSHYGGPLHEGRLETTSEPRVACPWHGSRFRLADGSVAAGPATVPQMSYEVRTVGDRLQIRARV